MDIRDINFLRKLDENRNKNYYARITVLDMDENPIQSIEGRVLQGSSISISGSSSMRRTCTINLIADKNENDLTDIENLLSINKKIRIYVGLDKDFDYIEDLLYVDENLPAEGQLGKVYQKHSDLTYWYWTGVEYKSLDNLFNYQRNLIWFPVGIYVISQPTLTNDVSNYNISLTCKDKMALLNGELGGNFPTSITFHEYDQVIGKLDVFWDKTAIPPKISELVTNPNDYTVYYYHFSFGEESWDKIYGWDKKYGWMENPSKSYNDIVHIENPIYDIIQTVVANYGNESLAKIIINDVPRELKQIVRYTGSAPLYYNSATDIYTLDENYIVNSENPDTWKAFGYNDDIGYVYTDFVFPRTLITNIGDNVCTVLDKICSVLGNYEYFYDIEGNFVFQEIRNYLNNSYNPTKKLYDVRKYYIDNNKSENMEDNFLKVIGQENYKTDFYGDQKSVYNFNQNNTLVTAYNNSPDYTNLKNDYHIWGKNPNNNNVIHYHVAIKEIPKPPYRERNIIFLRDKITKKFSGRIRMLNKDDYTQQNATASENSITFFNKEVEGTSIFEVDNDILYIRKNLDPDYTNGIIVSNIENQDGQILGAEQKQQLGITVGLDLVSYTPSDWRAELYLQGLEAIQQGKRPDIYQQELLDLFDAIYEWGYYDDEGKWAFKGRFKTETVYKPNNLNYWIDFLEPVDNFYGLSVDDIEPKLYSYQQDKIVKIYTDEVPNCILIDESMDDDYQQEIRDKCDEEGQPQSVIDKEIYASIAENTIGYSAQEVARNLLYQYTTYNEVILLQCLPIYYLDVNTRITVEDSKTGIYGDYIISSINIPLSPTGTMNINASKALNRI